MFEKKEKHGFIFKMLISSALISLIVSLLVNVISSGYIAGNRPVSDKNRLNSATRNAGTAGQTAGMGNRTADKGAQISQTADTAPRTGAQMSLTGIAAPQAGMQMPTDGGQPPNQTVQGQDVSLLTGLLAVAPSQAVARTATPGVVGITVEKVRKEELFGGKDGRTEVGVGSGVIVSSDGYILTNNHVADSSGTSRRIIVSFADGRNMDASLVWADPRIDLAVVKANVTGLTPLALGDATKLQVGEPAIAIGNPLGLEFQRTVTSGIISALNRTIQVDTDTGTNYMEDLIQTDASINPGNSGGPLLNAKGEVVGINTIKVTSAEAMGFAIPINIAKPIIRKLVATGAFKEPYLGLFAYDNSVLPYVGVESPVQNGIYVSHVDNGGPAYRAGIREGCVISMVDGLNMTTMLQLREYLYNKSPGDKISITHLMKGTNKWTTTQVTLSQKTKDGLITR